MAFHRTASDRRDATGASRSGDDARQRGMSSDWTAFSLHRSRGALGGHPHDRHRAPREDARRRRPRHCDGQRSLVRGRMYGRGMTLGWLMSVSLVLGCNAVLGNQSAELAAEDASPPPVDASIPVADLSPRRRPRSFRRRDGHGPLPRRPRMPPPLPTTFVAPRRLLPGAMASPTCSMGEKLCSGSYASSHGRPVLRLVHDELRPRLLSFRATTTCCCGFACAIGIACADPGHADCDQIAGQQLPGPIYAPSAHYVQHVTLRCAPCRPRLRPTSTPGGFACTTRLPCRPPRSAATPVRRISS